MNIPEVCPFCKVNIETVTEFYNADRVNWYGDKSVACGKCYFYCELTKNDVEYLEYFLQGCKVVCNINSNYTVIFGMEEEIIVKINKCLLPKSLDLKDLMCFQNKLLDLSIYS